MNGKASTLREELSLVREKMIAAIKEGLESRGLRELVIHSSINDDESDHDAAYAYIYHQDGVAYECVLSKVELTDEKEIEKSVRFSVIEPEGDDDELELEYPSTDEISDFMYAIQTELDELNQ